MSSASKGIFSQFFISSDPGVLKWLLILGGASFIGIGLLLNVLFPTFVCPKGIYFSLGIASIWLGVLEGVLPHIRKYLYEYAFWIYVGMYLFVIFLAYSNNLHIGFSLALVAVHILFSVSFRTMTEYTIFAVASLIFFSICTFFRPNLAISPLLFLSIICAISLLAGIYVWLREHRDVDMMEGGEMLANMLDNSSYSIFLIDLPKDELIYTNQQAKQMLMGLGGGSNKNVEEILSFFGVDKKVAQGMYDKLSYNELLPSTYTIKDNPGKPMELELKMGKVHSNLGDAFFIKARDISINKQQERSLERSVALNDSLMQAFPDSLVVIDAAGEIRSVRMDKRNANLPSLEQYIGETFEVMASQIMTASKQDEASLLLQKTRESGKVLQLEFLSAMANESRHFDLRFTPLSNSGEILAIIRDISEERETALHLEQSERNYREIFDSVGEGILILHPENLELIDLNEAASKLLGYSKQDKAGLPLESMSKDPDPEDFMRFLKAATQGVQNRLECILIAKDGNEVLVEIAGKLVILGGEFRLLISLIDIEERTKFLREVQSQALLVNTVSEAIISTDTDFRILSWNPAAEKIYGWNNKESIGKKLFDLLPTKVLGSSQERAHKELFEQGSWKGELEQQHKNNKAVRVRSSFTLIPPIKDESPRIVLLNRDISAEQDRITELKRSEQKFKDLFNSSPEPILVHNLKGEVLDANPAACELFKKERKALIGTGFHQLIPSKQREMTEGVYAAMTMGQLTYSESAILSGDGLEIPVEIRSSSFELDGEKRMILHISDVSQRKVSEQRLGLFNRLINQSGDAIFLLDSESGELVDANSQTYQILQNDSKLAQKSTQEGGKHLLFDNIPSPVMEEVKRTGSAIYTDKYPGRSGNYLPVEVNLGYIKSDSHAYLVGVARDITERLYQQNALHQSEQKYRTLVEKMNEGLLMTDNEETILFVNGSACSILRRDKTELIGKRSYEALGGEDSSKIIKEKSALRRKGISDQYELYLQHKNGDDLWLLVAGSPYVDSNGDTIGTIAILTDITTRKIAEIKLQEKNDELDAFVYRASHDLKGPLTSIIGVTNIARDEVNDPGALRYFDMISKSTERLDLTLSELIEATRVNNATVKLEPLNVNNLLEDIIGSLKHLPKSRNIEFQTEIKLSNGFISDRKLLSSILQNLIVNSINYHNLDHQQPFVKVSVQEQAEKVQFKVEDNGQGIPERLQKKVFEMFYRGNTQSKGSGLGLYIVKNSISRLEGSCELNSELGEGTTISFSLPQHHAG
ncbi:MAG: PAS domain S-box protein [Bacteroidia bacterium]|nr:PAS domain S-box protein [Bacteroidia bacterium]